MSDILFKKDGFVFSYRVAGIAVQNGKVLLQKPTNEDFMLFRADMLNSVKPMKKLLSVNLKRKLVRI